MNKEEIRVLEFSLWKFKFQDFWSVKTSIRSIEVMRKIILEFLHSIGVRFLLDQLKRAFDQFSIPLDRSKLVKTNFFAEFSDNYSKHLKMFQALWTVLWNILTLQMYLLKGYNPVSINRGLCSLQNSKFKRNTRNSVGILQNCYL